MNHDKASYQRAAHQIAQEAVAQGPISWEDLADAVISNANPAIPIKDYPLVEAACIQVCAEAGREALGMALTRIDEQARRATT